MTPRRHRAGTSCGVPGDRGRGKVPTTGPGVGRRDPASAGGSDDGKESDCWPPGGDPLAIGHSVLRDRVPPERSLRSPPSRRSGAIHDLCERRFVVDRYNPGGINFRSRPLDQCCASSHTTPSIRAAGAERAGTILRCSRRPGRGRSGPCRLGCLGVRTRRLSAACKLPSGLQFLTTGTRLTMTARYWHTATSDAQSARGIVAGSFSGCSLSGC